MRAGLGLGDVTRVTRPPSTVAEVVRKAADQFNRRRSAPLAAAVFKRWFTLTR
jgi:hypothetical protein